MNLRRLGKMAPVLFGTVVLVGGVIATIAGRGMADVKNAHPAAIDDRGIENGGSAGSNPGSVTVATATAVITKTWLPDDSRGSAAEPKPVLLAAAGSDLPDAATDLVSPAETSDESLPEPFATHNPETPPVQVPTASTSDLIHSDAKGNSDSIAALGESSPDLSQGLAPQTPANDAQDKSSSRAADLCAARQTCIDEYLWSLYQRAPKQDTVKVVERKKVLVKADGQPRSVAKEVAKLVDEDFTWKDPKAAEKAGMSLMEYVIGGMDQGFKLKLYHALHAVDDAGLAPGITSAFRDDYRQSLASGLKAAIERSYHGGSFRGGYGHGLAVDLVSVKGETRAERLVSSENLWKWIDVHGKEFGIGRPYLAKDPAHVAPIDGKEYADHRRGAPTQQARSEAKGTKVLAASDDHGIAKITKAVRSSFSW